jgi:hypothetical protein
MNIEAFLLCDAATDQQGKLNVLGAFDNIFTQKTPVQYPACAVAARIRFEKVEEGEHSIRIYIMDEDGASVGPKLNGNITVRVPENVGTAVANLILNIHGLEFKRFGKYRIDLAVDGNIQASLPLRVNQVPARPSSHPSESSDHNH